MKSILVMVTVVSATALCSNLSACGGGGGMGGGGRSAHGGGIVDVSAHRASGAATNSTNEGDAFSKAALPPAVTVLTLNTASYDDAASQLSLSKDQEQQIAGVVKQIREVAKKLADLQTTTRATYDAATTKTGIFDAARHVIEAADAIKSFDPNATFQAALANILTEDQRARYRVLKNKKAYAMP